MGEANAANGNAPPLCLFRLPPIYQIPLLTDCFFFLKSHRLLVWCCMFCGVTLNPLTPIGIDTPPENVPRFLAEVFLVAVSFTLI